MLHRWLPVVALLVAGIARGQSVQPARVSVFLDCQTGCDGDLIRTEITWVDWVRDRLVADVHALITSQSAGAGGSEYSVAFLGQRAFQGRGDTLRHFVSPTATDDERRRALVRTLALGLVPFASKTGVGAELQVTRMEEEDRPRSSSAAQKDPWHAWVFEINVGGSMNGERFDRNRELESGWSARRVTEQWKTNVFLGLDYSDNRTIVQEFDSLGVVESEETFTTIRRNWSAEGLVVKSLGAHWSGGLKTELESNSFRNIKRSFVLAPAIEFDIYPYAEATRRQLVFQYAIGVKDFRYVDTTIFDKIRETLPVHQLQANYETRQPWGSADLSIEHLVYLSDASKRNTQLDGSIDVRLFKGFSVEVGGSYNWVHDQLYLRRGRRDVVDVLLRRQQLLTGYEYGFRAGISYTFGSIFNNVVNPRF